MLTVNKKIGSAKVQFNPAFYQKAYKSYLNGEYKDIIALMKSAADDSHCAGCLIGRQAGFQREWQIKPFDPDNAEDQQRSLWIESMLNRINTRSLFKKIHESTLYIYRVIDFEWEVIDNRQEITTFEAFDQRYFRYDKDTGVLKIDHGNRLEEIPDTALICETDEKPVMLPVIRDFILKNFGLEAWASFIETFGEPFMMGFYPPGSDTTVVTALQEALDAMAMSSRGTAPKGTEVEIKEVSRTTGDHMKFTHAADTGMSIAILGHANAVNDTGGLKLGENLAPYKVKQNIAIDDMFFIQSCMNKLIEMIYRRNYADNRIPRMEIDKSEPINVSERLDVIDAFYRMGGEVDPVDFMKLGIRVSPDQEPLKKQGLFDE